MLWILVDLALVVVPLAVVVVLVLGLWRRVKRLAAAGERLSAVMDQASGLSVGAPASLSTPVRPSPPVDTRRSPGRRR